MKISNFCSDKGPFQNEAQVVNKEIIAQMKPKDKVCTVMRQNLNQYFSSVFVLTKHHAL